MINNQHIFSKWNSKNKKRENKENTHAHSHITYYLINISFLFFSSLFRYMFWFKKKRITHTNRIEKNARAGEANQYDKRWTKCIRILYFRFDCKPVDSVDAFINCIHLLSFSIHFSSSIFLFFPFGSFLFWEIFAYIFFSSFVCMFTFHTCSHIHIHTLYTTRTQNDLKKRSHTFVWLKLILLIWKNQMKLELNEIKSRKINNFIWNKKCKKKHKLRFHSL